MNCGKLLIFVQIAIIISLADCKIHLSSPVLTNTGEWKDWQMCSPGKFVVAVDVSAYSHSTDFTDDDLALVNIVMECNEVPHHVSDPDYIVTEIDGVQVNIGKKFIANKTKDAIEEDILVSYKTPLRTRCSGAAIGFQVMSEGPKGSEDDTGLNNIRLYCSDLQQNNPLYVEAYGQYNGEWTMEQMCPPRHLLCGLQAQVQDLKENVNDQIGIENIRIACCEVQSLASQCTPTYKWELVEVTGKTNSPTIPPCTYLPSVGIQVDLEQNVALNTDAEFFEAIGYNIDPVVSRSQRVRSELYKKITEELTESDGFVWSTSSSRNWEVLSPGQMHTFVCASPNAQNYRTVKIYQLVAQCSFYKVRTQRFRKVDIVESVNTGDETVTEIEFGN